MLAGSKETYAVNNSRKTNNSIFSSCTFSVAASSAFLAVVGYLPYMLMDMFNDKSQIPLRYPACDQLASRIT